MPRKQTGLPPKTIGKAPRRTIATSRAKGRAASEPPPAPPAASDAEAKLEVLNKRLAAAEAKVQTLTERLAIPEFFL